MSPDMAQKNRRHFLEQSLLASAAAIAMQSRFENRVSADDQLSPSVGPNDVIRVAVVGAGGRGQSHIGGFAGNKGTQVTHICDCDERAGQQSCEATKEKQNGLRPTWIKDIRRLLEDPSIDVISIATPNHWHSLGAIWAVQAGKDVYVEKPVSHNVLEGRRLVQTARKHNRIVQTGTQSRSNPGMRDLMAFLHAKGIGDLKIARGLCYKRRDSIGPKGNYDVPKEVDYDLWSGPAPILPVTRKRFHYDWHWQWAYGNGDLGNQGIHQMDLCRWALGVNQLCDRTFSFGGRFGYEDAGETANSQIAIHDYGQQQIVFEVRGLPTESFKEAMVGIIIEGTNGYAVATSYSDATAFDLKGNAIKSFHGGGDEKHYANFQDAVRKRDHKILHADIEDGHLSSALCHLSNISLQLGTEVDSVDVAGKLQDIDGPENVVANWQRMSDHLKANKVDNYQVKIGPRLKFDPIAETFPGNSTANSMLTREYRRGYEIPSEAAV
jgi:predicted dehydrogenase